MDKGTDFQKLREAILDFEDCSSSPVARETFNNWRHHCFTNYPVGEVLSFIADVYKEVGNKAKSEFSKFPRRWTQSQHC